MVKEGSRKDGGHILPEIAQLFPPRNVCFATQSVIFFLHWYDVTLGPAANL